MHRYPGLGDRIRTRLLALGYVKGGRADTQRFCQERGYRPQYVYAWLKDRVPTYENLQRLSQDLAVTMPWLTFGQEIPEAERQAFPVAMPQAERRPGGRQGGALFRGGRARPGGRVGHPGRRQPAEERAAPPGQLIDFQRLREATERLVRLEAEVDALFRAFPDLYLWVDADGVILSGKVGRESDFQLPATPLEGTSVFDLVPAEVGGQIRAAYEKAVSEDEVYSLEYTLPRRDGPRFREARFVVRGQGRRRTVFAIVRDVTARRQAEEATRALGRVGQDLVGPADLTEVAERVAAALLSLFRVQRAGVWRLDPDGQALVCLAAAGGPDPADWVGRRFPCRGLLSGLAAVEGRPTWTEDLLGDPRVEVSDDLRSLVEAQGIRSGLSVPLAVRGRPLGTLFIGGDPPGRPLSGDEMGLLTAFADQAALAMEHARLLGELDRRRRTAEALAEVGRLLSQSLDPGELARLIVDCALRLLEVRAATLYVVDDRTGDLVVEAHADSVEPQHLVGRGREGPGAASRAVSESRVVVIDEAPIDTPGGSEEDRAAGTGGSAMAVPLVARDRTIGALEVRHAGGRRFEDEDRRTLQFMADHAAAVVQNARLHAASERGRLLAEGLAKLGGPEPGALGAEEMRHRVVEGVLALLRARTAVLYRLTESGDLRSVAVAGDPDPTQGERIVLPRGSGMGGLAVRTRGPVACEDYLAESRVLLSDEERQRLARIPTRAILSVPLMAEDGVLGALSVWDRTGRRFSAEDVAVTQRFAAKAGPVLRQADRAAGTTSEGAGS